MESKKGNLLIQTRYHKGSLLQSYGSGCSRCGRSPQTVSITEDSYKSRTLFCQRIRQWSSAMPSVQNFILCEHLK